MNRTTGTVLWLGLVQTYLKRHLTDSVLTEVRNRVAQTRQQPEKDEKNYG